ncbi:hypothetical protein ACR6C2_43160 [Streptomyces sp. INA 01156]
MRGFVNQPSDASRSLEQTLEDAWQALLTLPRGQLSMLPAALLDEHGAREAPEDQDEVSDMPGEEGTPP